MNRALLRSEAFIRAAKKTVKKYPEKAAEIDKTLKILRTDAFHPKLNTHKLKGCLEDSWACSASYELRIVFSFVSHEGKEAILLQAIGTHEEVY